MHRIIFAPHAKGRKRENISFESSREVIEKRKFRGEKGGLIKKKKKNFLGGKETR